MQFTKRRLDLVRYGIALAVSEAHNQIVTCPDPERYAAEVDSYKALKRELEKLLDRIDKQTAKEQRNGTQRP
jgi:Skp family chaperone for outer membrane proteins